MQSFKKTFPAWAAVSVAMLGAAVLSSQVSVNANPARVSKTFTTAPAAPAAVAKAASTAAAAVAKVAPAAAVAALTPAKPAMRLGNSVAKPAMRLATDESLRAKIKFETVRWGGKPVQTLDEESRILLAKAAAEKAGLHKVGLSYQDLYGIIEAETSWIPRTGASKNGTPNLGLAQFEPRTAEGMGITDPSDPLQAVFGAAMYIKQGAVWAADKIDGLKLSPQERAAKLREGVSVHYNLSVKGRNKWDGRNTAELPVETQRHIRNARAGAAEAAQLSRLLKT
jgi:hypothetical protein